MTVLMDPLRALAIEVVGIVQFADNDQNAVTGVLESLRRHEWQTNRPPLNILNRFEHDAFLAALQGAAISELPEAYAVTRARRMAKLAVKEAKPVSEPLPQADQVDK